MIDSILSIINKFIPDQDKAKEAATKLEAEYTRQMELKQQIIMAETSNGSGKWRIKLMYLCMIMVGAHFIMYDIIPYIRTVFDLNFWVPESPPNEELWSFLKLGVGGYIGGRSVEKSIAWFKSK